MTDEKRSEWQAIGIVVVLVCVGAGCYLIGTHTSQSDLEAAEKVGYEQGCSDIIEAYYRNQPYYKAILDSRMYEDTVLMGWIVRQFKDPHLPDPIAIHAWDSLGYCVMCGKYRLDPTDTMPALEPDTLGEVKP